MGIVSKKRAFIEYVDLSIAILNTSILVFATFVFPKNIIFTVITLFSTIVICGLFLATFLRNNPYYIIPCYGMVLFGLIFTFGLLTLPTYYASLLWIGFLIILILDIIYIANLIKGSASSASRVATAGGRVWTLVEPGTDTPTYIKGGIIDRKKKKKIQKKYQAPQIFFITFISLLFYFIMVIL